MGKTDETTSKCEKGLLIGWVTFMAVYGITKIVIGFVHVTGCPSFPFLPAFLCASGFLFLVPPTVAMVRNCPYGKARPGEGLADCHPFMTFLLLATICIYLGDALLYKFAENFVFTASIHILPNAIDPNDNRHFCFATWLRPFGVAALLVDYVCIGFFCRLFCCLGAGQSPAPPTRVIGTGGRWQRPLRHHSIPMNGR